MRPILSREQAIQSEADWYLTAGIQNQFELMHRAAFGIAVSVAGLLKSTYGGVSGSTVLLLVGPGNNGGDALWAGSLLTKRGISVKAILINSAVHEIAFEKFTKAGGQVISADAIGSTNPHVILDGIHGLGFHGQLEENTAKLINQAWHVAPIVAIDLPSGLDSDSGLVAVGAVQAEVTLTIGALKPGLLTGDGKSNAGVIKVIDIGVDYPVQPVNAVDINDLADVYQVAQPSSHKYSRGVVSVRAGSVRYPGAGVLTVGGARASGAGLVRISSPAQDFVCQTYPDVVPSDSLEKVSGLVIGPGDSSTLEELAELLKNEIPIVIDAGALAFVKDHQVSALLLARHAKGLTTVLTPHDGESAQMGFSEVGRIQRTQAIASAFGCTVVLKGSGTVIADPTGKLFIDTFGTSALATAGTGDVLSGLIAGTLASHPEAEPLLLVASAVGLHGLAGRIAGPSCTATQLPEFLRQARTQVLDARE